MTSGKANSPGRLPISEKKARQTAVLKAALRELQVSGYNGLTMQKVAKRAKCSKETLYAWYENKQGLLTKLIEQNADEAAANLEVAFESNAKPELVLQGFCIGLITLLSSKQSVTLNHAAMASPELAKILLRSGRYRAGPIVKQYLEKLMVDGDLKKTNSEEAFTLLYGLAVRDVQIRVLLGERAPTKSEIESMCERAVDLFFKLSGSIAGNS